MIYYDLPLNLNHFKEPSQTKQLRLKTKLAYEKVRYFAKLSHAQDQLCSVSSSEFPHSPRALNAAKNVERDMLWALWWAL